MKAKSCYTLFVLLYLFSAVFNTSCTQPSKRKPLTFVPNSHVENLLREAYKLYYQGRFNEAAQKLGLASESVPKDPPSWSAAIFYSILALFEEKSGDTTKSSITYEEVKKLLVGLKGILPVEDHVNSPVWRGVGSS